jgi:HlyD family secretion protein
MKKAILLVLLLAGCEKPADVLWQGYVEGEFVLLASPHAGQLQKLHVRRGARVEVGQPLFALESEAERAAREEAAERLKVAEARLENLRAGRRAPEIEALRAELAVAKAAQELAVANLKREEKLLADAATPRSRYDEARSTLARDRARVAAAEAQLRSAEQPLGRDAERAAAQAEVAAARAALEQAQWRLGQKSVAAPASGLVQDTFFAEGEWVLAGRPVVSLLPPGNLKARFYVPEALLASMKPGQPVEVSCDGCPAPIASKVTFVSSQAEYTPPVLYSKQSRSKLVFLVEARLDPAAAKSLNPGQPVDVRLK